jgi:hypothetical protein
MTALEDGLETARRLSHLIERAERTLDVMAEGGLRLHPTTVAALRGRRNPRVGGALPWILCLMLAGLALGLLLR